jgi:HSP20 family protein
MLSVKLNRKPFDRSFDQLIDGIWNEFPVLLKQDFNGWDKKLSAPVNVIETDKGYRLDLVVPGFEKTDISIGLDNNLLTIAGERKDDPKEENEKPLKKEYNFRSFKRTFTIDEKIDATGIEANYVNGVLALNLPKKTEVKTATKEIEIK